MTSWMESSSDSTVGESPSPSMLDLTIAQLSPESGFMVYSTILPSC